MSDLFDRLITRPTRTDEATFAYHPEDARRLAEASQKVEQAKLRLDVFRDGDGARAAQEALDQATADLEALEAEVVRFTVHLAGIGPSKVQELVAQHPPTSEQKVKGRRDANGDPAGEPDFNIDTFGPALLAATVQRISFTDRDDAMEGLTVDQATELWNGTWPTGDRNLIFNRANSLDSTPSLVEDLGKG